MANCTVAGTQTGVGGRLGQTMLIHMYREPGLEISDSVRWKTYRPTLEDEFNSKYEGLVIL